MLFKRFFEGKSVLNAEAKRKAQEKCSRRRSECHGCLEHSTILEETMKMVLLGVVLWVGVSFGSQVAPYPLNLIFTNHIIHPPPMYDFPFPSGDILKRLPPVTPAQTNRSIAIAQLGISMLQRLEDNIEASGILPKHGSAAEGFAIHGHPIDEALRYEKSSMTITKASQNLVVNKCSRYGVATDECASFISTLNIRDSDYGGECASLERFSCRPTKLSSRYRSFDGSCNNPRRSSWGQALTGYKRLLHPRYADGIEEPRRGASHQPLPSARLVSVRLADNLDRPSDERTVALAVFSQFIHHDMVHTPVRRTVHTNQPIRCCDSTGYHLAPRHLHPSCLPIHVPSDDTHFNGRYVSCMEYTRSVTTYRGDCTFGAAEQMNQVSHFLDGSSVYGSSSRQATALREPGSGLLKTSGSAEDQLMPDGDAARCLGGACFKSGDIRSNVHPWLTSLHTLYVREHNRIVRALAEVNPHWSPDKLYHEARRIVVAEIQHVTYKHWLPSVVGKSFEDLYESYDVGFSRDVDPTVSNPFATAAFHFVHSILDKDLRVVSGDNVTEYRLKDHYYKPEIVARSGHLDGLVESMVRERSQQLDFNYDDDIRHHYLGGLDALAVDTQRGRDHGLPGYTHYRALCGLPAVAAFHQLADTMEPEVIEKLSSVYASVEDIDLVVGALAETPRGGLLGPTFTCIIKEQLYRTRVGDRYFYSHAGEAGAFSKRQLAELRRASLARLVCDTARAASVPRDVFRPLGDNNPLLPCAEVKGINLEAWRDPEHRPGILARTNTWIKAQVGNATK